MSKINEVLLLSTYSLLPDGIRHLLERSGLDKYYVDIIYPSRNDLKNIEKESDIHIKISGKADLSPKVLKMVGSFSPKAKNRYLFSGAFGDSKDYRLIFDKVS